MSRVQLCNVITDTLDLWSYMTIGHRPTRKIGWSDTLSKTKSYERLMSQMSHLVFFVSNTQVATYFDKYKKNMFEMFSPFALKPEIQ